MFKKFWLDTILATAFIFGLMGLLASVTAFKIFDVFDPIGEAFEEMEFSDIVFSQLRDDPVADERIVLVNIGQVSRGEIGIMLDIINKHNPRVIGIDSFFNFPKDSLGDAIFEEALSQIDNLVMATKLIYNPETDKVDSVHYSWPQFSRHAEPAYANLDTEAENQDDVKMCRRFVPQYEVKGEKQLALAVRMASLYDSALTARFLSRNNEREVVNYRGNVLDYGATKFGTKYYALDVYDVMNANFVPELIEGKIVLFCFLGEFLGDHESLEDKFYTPLNEKYIGKAFPDMYGGVIHANIISMILNEDYIDAMTPFQGIFLAVFLCFANVALFSLIYRRIPRWYDGITKLFQLIEIFGLIFLLIYVLDSFDYIIEMGLTLFAIGISGDALEVYYGVVKNSFTKAGRRSLFKVDKF